MNQFANDIALISAFNEGQTLAGKVIFDNYFKPLCLFAERITGDMLQSEDIVAEAFEKAMLRSEDFSAICNLKAFLYRVVHNASINYISLQKRHAAAHEQIRYLAENSEEETATFQNEVLRAELLHEIYKEMDKLPDKCGLVFKMIFVEELPTSVIAEKLGINVQTVRTQKARALELIRNAILKKNPNAALILSSYFAFLPLIRELFPVD